MPGSRLAVAAMLATAASLLLTPSASAQRHCGKTRIPAELPAVDAIVDSAAIAALIAGSGAEGVLRFSIVADVGEAPQVYPVAGGGASPAAGWLAPRVDEALRTVPRPSVAWGVRLVASTDSTPQISLEPSEYCRPQPMPTSLRTTIRLVRPAGSPRPQPPFYSVRISSAGDVRSVSFIRSGDSDFESEIRRVAMGMRYHPARIDGVPVASVDTIGRR